MDKGKGSGVRVTVASIQRGRRGGGGEKYFDVR